ncbi:MAG TPA: DUF892 family protein [Armatimonadota bacterium]|nr:DUF892 family protein [Armatimonadota bacterium]
MALGSVHDLFARDLCVILSGEKTGAQMLPMLGNQPYSEEARSAIQRHERETQEQIRKVEQCLQLLGREAREIPCHTVQGLREDHQAFLDESPSEDLRLIFGLGTAIKMEQHEVAVYSDLLDIARMLGEQECARLLEENLRQEEAMAANVRRMMLQLSRQLVPQTAAGETGGSPGILAARKEGEPDTGDSFTATSEGGTTAGPGLGTAITPPGEGGILTGPAGRDEV